MSIQLLSNCLTLYTCDMIKPAAWPGSKALGHRPPVAVKGCLIENLKEWLQYQWKYLVSGHNCYSNII